MINLIVKKNHIIYRKMKFNIMSKLKNNFV